MDTIQEALKALYYSLGGNADNVRKTDDVNVIIAAIGALGIGASLAAASIPELPAVPEEDGTYALLSSLPVKQAARLHQQYNYPKFQRRSRALFVPVTLQAFQPGSCLFS